MSETERWKWIIRSYEEWIEAVHDMKPQLDLVKQIAVSKYAGEFYPYTSIAALNISNYENYADQIKSPSISVRYLGNNLFEITFTDNLLNKHHKIEKFKSHQSQVVSLLQSLLLRMKLCKSET